MAQEDDDTLMATATGGLSATAAAAVEFAIRRPGLSVPQKDRVTAVIRVLDKMSKRERNVIRALVTEAKAEYPEIPAEMPLGTQSEDMERASLYYEIEERESDRWWDRVFKLATIPGGAAAFILTWGLQIYTTLWQIRPAP
jgi:hypothetical protein